MGLDHVQVCIIEQGSYFSVAKAQTPVCVDIPEPFDLMRGKIDNRERSPG